MIKKIFLISLLVLSLYSCDSFSKQSSEQNNSENTELSSNDNSDIIGSWSLSNPPKNVTVDFKFNSDGTLVMHGVEQPKLGIIPEEKNINCSWSKNGNIVYITTPGESKVGVMEILSLDSKSLVAHFKGEPEDEIMYFTKK